MTTDMTTLRFGAFVFRPDTMELRTEDGPVSLPPKASIVLTTLVRNAGRLVTREELYHAAWGNTVVEFDQALNTSVRQIRAALGDDARAPSYIETVPRRGYRFCREVHEEAATQRSSANGPRHRWRALNIRRARSLAAAMALLVAWVGGRLATARVSRAGADVPAVDFNVSAPTDALDGIDRALEAAVRSSWNRQHSAGGAFAASTTGVMVTGTVVATDDGARLHALILRVSDGTVVWAGMFNPFCPDVPNPVAAIGYYLADQLGRSANTT